MFPLTRLQKILLILFIISGLVFVGVMLYLNFQPTGDMAGPEAASTMTDEQVMVISTAAAAVASCLSTVISLLAFLFTVWLETRRNSV